MVAVEVERERGMEGFPSKEQLELNLRCEPLRDGQGLSTTEDIPVEAYSVLYQLASAWDDVTDHQKVSLKPLKGAMTNEVFECHWDSTNEQANSRRVLLRVYGESADLFFNRDDEIMTFERMSQQGQGPKLLARFGTGRVEQFLHARTLTASDLTNTEITDRIAKKLREFHALKLPLPAKPMVWDRIRVWLEKAQDLASPRLIKELSLDKLSEEIDNLERTLCRPGEKIGFCHNDLQYGNVMMDDNDGTITIIDYEYATFNPVAFDIANFFCEMAADYHTDTPHVLDYDRYPDYQARRRFVLKYLQASGESIKKEEVEDFVNNVEVYKLPCHLLWGLWGVISALTSDLDFNYHSYARQRFEQYYLEKERTSSL